MNNTQQILDKIIKFIDDYYKVAPLYYRGWFDKLGIENYNKIKNIKIQNDSDEILDYLDYCIYMLEECDNQFTHRGNEVVGFQIASIMKGIVESKELMIKKE
jgi:hypothetical protein